MVHHHKHLSALTLAELSHLANLLTLPSRLFTTGHPSTLWLATQARLIATTLPKPLLACHSLLARLSAATHRAVAPELLAVLCPAHTGLNARLIRRIFLLIHAEITRHAQPLRRYLGHPRRYAQLEPRLSAATATAVRALVDRLAGLAALWLPPGAFARLHPGMEAAWVRVEGGCEACILAAVGGDAGIVGDLRAVLMGRTHARKKEGPVLAGLVGAWMGNGGEEEKRASEELGRVVKRVRRAIWRARHEGREDGSMRAVGNSGGGSVRDSGYVSAATMSGGAGPGERPRRQEERLQPTIVESDSYPRKRQDQHQQRGSSNTTTHAKQPRTVAIVANEDEIDDSDLDDADPDATRQLHARASGWYSTHTDLVDAEQHPAFRVSVAIHDVMSTCPMAAPPPILSWPDVSPRDDVYDPAQWTDVSVAESGAAPLAHHTAVSSSSVYSTDGTAVPHPEPTMVGGSLTTGGVSGKEGKTAHFWPLRSDAMRSLVTDEWPTPLTAATTTSTTPHENPFTTTTPVSSASTSTQQQSTLATEVCDAALSPVEFQRALDRLSLVEPLAPFESVGVPEGTVLPEQSVSVVGELCPVAAYSACHDERGTGIRSLATSSQAETEDVRLRSAAPEQQQHQQPPLASSWNHLRVACVAEQRPGLWESNSGSSSRRTSEDAQMRRAVVRSRVTAIEEAERMGKGGW